MSKVDILRLDSVTTNDTKATALINTNFQNIQNVIETLLSRNGTTPNYMDAVLDMNSYRIINTAAPTEDFDVVNLKYLRDYVGNLEELVENARQYANTAILNAQNAAGSANVAATASQTALEARDAAVDAAIEVQGIKEDVEGIAQDIEGIIDDPNLVAVGTDLRDPDGKINTVLDGAEVLIDGRYGTDLSFSNGELQLLDQNGSGLGSSVEIDVLPSQAGNAGKFLTTNGTSPSWEDNPDTNPYKGVYDASVTYNRGDYVRYASGNTRYWVCDIDGTVGQTPSEGTYWHAFSDTYHLRADLVTDNANYQLLLMADTNSLQHTGKGKYSPNAPKVNANTGEIIGYAKTTDLPTVNNSQITFTQGGVTKGTITLNQSSDATIALDAGGGSGSVDIDNSTITTNANDEIQAEGTLNHNTATGATNPIYDWVGTTAEYEAQNVATTHPEWLCFITDDTTPDVSTLANKDLSNLTSTGKSTAAELSMPSDSYINLTVPASESLYTAPANGYVSMYVLTNGAGAITLDNVDIQANIGSVIWSPSSQGLAAFVPVRKGQSVRIGYVNINQFLSFKFIYAQGEL